MINPQPEMEQKILQQNKEQGVAKSKLQKGVELKYGYFEYLAKGYSPAKQKLVHNHQAKIPGFYLSEKGKQEEN